MKLKYTEIAKLLGIHPNTVTSYIKSGKLSGDTIEDVIEYIKRQEFSKMKQTLLNMSYEEYRKLPK